MKKRKDQKNWKNSPKHKGRSNNTEKKFKFAKGEYKLLIR